MKRTSTLKTSFALVTATLGMGVLGALLATRADAGCGDAPRKQSPSSSPLRPQSGAGLGRFAPAVYWAGSYEDGAFNPVVDTGAENAAIVGLWEFEVRATVDEGPFRKGDLIDWGLATWHDDGTEIQFSAGRPYDAGDVCMGVWRPTGPSRFHLNHIALGKDLGTGATFDGLTNIRADVKVNAAGNQFTGSYQIIQYSGNPADGTEFDQSSVQYQFIGAVAAWRVTAN